MVVCKTCGGNKGICQCDKTFDIFDKVKVKRRVSGKTYTICRIVRQTGTRTIYYLDGCSSGSFAGHLEDELMKVT